MATISQILEHDLIARQAQIDARRRDLARPAPTVDELDRVRADYAGLFERAGAGNAPFPLRNESADSYRRRMINAVKGLAPGYRSIDAYALSPDALPAVEATIRAEVERTLADPHVGDLDRGGRGLRRVDSTDESGRRVTEWRGDTWFGAQLMPPAQYVRHVRTGHPPVVRWIGPRINQRG